MFNAFSSKIYVLTALIKLLSLQTSFAGLHSDLIGCVNRFFVVISSSWLCATD